MKANSKPDRVLVTGAGTRLGLHIATTLLERGFDVIAHYRASADGVRQLESRFSTRVQSIQADLSEDGAAQRLLDSAGADIAHVVLSAGIFEKQEFEQVRRADLMRVMTTNVFASMELVQAARPHLARNNGSVVLLTCTSAEQPYRNFLPYVLSKAAARQLMRTLALELAPEIRVNAIAPGTVLPPESMSLEEGKTLAAKTLLARLGSAQDVSNAVLYLLGAKFTTGQELVIDGGATLKGNPIGEG